MKEYLIFRTDRVGDFLLTLSLIKIIKINHPESKITIIASEKNFDYIKTFKVVIMYLGYFIFLYEEIINNLERTLTIIIFLIACIDTFYLYYNKLKDFSN